MVFEIGHLQIIRQTTNEELHEFLKIYCDRETMQFIQDGKYNWTFEELRNRFSDYNRTAYPKGIGMFLVQLKDTGEIIGEASLFDSFGSTTEPEAGYLLKSGYRNRGLGKELCKGLTDYAFHELGAHIVYARMYEANRASTALCESSGFELIERGLAPNGKLFRKYAIRRKK